MEQKPYIFKFLRDKYKLNYIDKELASRKYNEKISFFSASFFWNSTLAWSNTQKQLGLIINVNAILM